MDIKGSADLTYNYTLECFIYKKIYTCKQCKKTYTFMIDIDRDFVKRLGYNIITEYIEETYDIIYCKDCKELVKRRNKILKIKNRI